MLRRRKAEVRGELPPVILQDLKLELAPVQRERYEDIWASRREASLGSAQDTSVALLAQITRLKIVCNLDADASVSSKLEALQEICTGAGRNARILVFSQFVETLKWISDRIPLPSDLLTGAMSGDIRHASMERFKSGGAPRVLFVSLRAGGVGINLGEASHVIVFDRWWNPAVEMQAIFRAHRFDRDEPLHVVRFLVSDTIEERIAEILDEKESMFENVVESAKTKARGFTIQELMRILELPVGDVCPAQPEKEDG